MCFLQPSGIWNGVLEGAQAVWSLTWALTLAEGSEAGSRGQSCPRDGDGTRGTKLRSASKELTLDSPHLGEAGSSLWV